MNTDAFMAICYSPPLVGLFSIVIRGVMVTTRRASTPQRPTRTPGILYRALNTFQWVFMAAAFLAYFFALFAPAVKNEWGGGLSLGWQALMIGFPFWGLNAYFFMSPIVLLWIGRIHDFRLQVIAFGVQLACALIVFYTVTRPDPDDIYGPHPGAILWSVAFWLVLAAYAIPTTLIRETEKPTPTPKEPTRQWTEW